MLIARQIADLLRSRDDAIGLTKEDRAAFEPALEIIAEEYDVAIEASHHGSTAAD